MRSHRSFHGEMDQIRKEVMGLAMELVSGCNFKRAMHERGTIVSERQQACQLVRRVVKYIGTICSASCIQMGKGPQLQERNDMLGNLGAGFWLVEPAGGFSKCPCTAHHLSQVGAHNFAEHPTRQAQNDISLKEEKTVSWASLRYSLAVS